MKCFTSGETGAIPNSYVDKLKDIRKNKNS